MEFKKIIEEKSKQAWEIYLPNLSIDCVVFGFHDALVKVLVVKMKENNLWALPGGYILKTENIKEAASRILHQRTGVTNIYLQQFRVFSDLNRSEGFFEAFENTIWNKQRFLSVGFYALVDFSTVKLVVDNFSDACEWKAIDELPELMMDHQYIFDKALGTLRKELNYKPIGFNLLPEKFTMPELQKLYEIILGKKLNRGNFFRKMLRYDILIKLDESRKGGAHKAPDLYKFDVEKYQLALKDGLNEGW
ncbi:NUDIX hydrolase [Flavobacterium restrictum]|uniref:NUDIX domain-containing protein n=1 Tax=Flavobacterium restrictum TaxID=2594428 RepID=A0A553E5S3_9FLAO|nr:NUDIX domain-containing protein [Flavobacterium restrictum]TRX40350.1 NUDIX domain-containing protein [Flavobacterium restrictum]